MEAFDFVGQKVRVGDRVRRVFSDPEETGVVSEVKTGGILWVCWGSNYTWKIKAKRVTRIDSQVEGVSDDGTRN